MPLAYADQFYVLREHIGFVRERLTRPREAHAEAQETAPPAAEPPADAGAPAQAAEQETAQAVEEKAEHEGQHEGQPQQAADADRDGQISSDAPRAGQAGPTHIA
jgi:hypothetical protein